MTVNKDVLTHQLKQHLANTLHEHEQTKGSLEQEISKLELIISNHKIKMSSLNDQILRVSNLLVCLDKLLK